MRRFLPKYHHLYIADVDCGVYPRIQGLANFPVCGGGTHICLGKVYAQLELHVLAIQIAKYYKVEVRNPKKKLFPMNDWDIELRLTQRK